MRAALSTAWRAGDHEKADQSSQAADALISRKLTEAYQARPPYQRNDYIGWIMRAKLPATKDKRLAQMLDELERGGVYMKMAYLPKRTLQDRSAQYGERPARRRDH
jgi:hypothetical protein